MVCTFEYRIAQISARYHRTSPIDGLGRLCDGHELVSCPLQYQQRACGRLPTVFRERTQRAEVVRLVPTPSRERNGRIVEGLGTCGLAALYIIKEVVVRQPGLCYSVAQREVWKHRRCGGCCQRNETPEARQV